MTATNSQATLDQAASITLDSADLLCIGSLLDLTIDRSNQIEDQHLAKSIKALATATASMIGVNLDNN